MYNNVVRTKPVKALLIYRTREIQNRILRNGALQYGNGFHTIHDSEHHQHV
jgi:hypothetical protein